MAAAGNSHAEHLHFQRDATDASAFWRRPNRANRSERRTLAGPVSPDRRCRVRSSKSYKRHQTGAEKSSLKKNQKEEQVQVIPAKHFSLSVAPYLIFVHLTQRPTHRPTAPVSLLCTRPFGRFVRAHQITSPCCHSLVDFLSGRPCEAARARAK